LCNRADDLVLVGKTMGKSDETENEEREREPSIDVHPRWMELIKERQGSMKDAELSRRAKISPSALSRFFRGQCTPKVARALADHFGLPYPMQSLTGPEENKLLDAMRSLHDLDHELWTDLIEHVSRLAQIRVEERTILAHIADRGKRKKSDPGGKT
jgi:transcriptional regulator with XRE-family HTH domain